MNETNKSDVMEISLMEKFTLIHQKTPLLLTRKARLIVKRNLLFFRTIQKRQ